MSGKVMSSGVTGGKKQFITNSSLITHNSSLITHNLSLITYHLSLITCIAFFSCGGGEPQVPSNKIPEVSIQEDMMLLNREFLEFENEEINNYIDSLNLGMLQSATGLRYKIIKEGEGAFPKKGDKVTFSYSIRTLDNTECEELKNVTKTVELGKGELKSGIEEAVMLLKVLGQGSFIIPSYLAYGVAGYKDCVSAWTPVFCEINVMDVKNRKNADDADNTDLHR